MYLNTVDSNTVRLAVPGLSFLRRLPKVGRYGARHAGKVSFLKKVPWKAIGIGAGLGAGYTAIFGLPGQVGPGEILYAMYRGRREQVSRRGGKEGRLKSAYRAFRPYKPIRHGG